MKSLLPALIACAALAGCAADARRVVLPGMAPDEVSARVGTPIAEGRRANDELYWDYTRQPFGYAIYRVTFGAEGRVRDVRNLLTEQNFRNLQPGMTPGEVAAIVGPSPERYAYWNGTSSWSYRYRDGEIVKLLHVIFDPADRLLSYYWEWDPSVYSRGGSRSKSHPHGR